MKTTKEAKKGFKLVIAAAIAGISLSGCGTITNAHVRHMNNQELVLARMQVMSRLAVHTIPAAALATMATLAPNREKKNPSNGK